MSRAQQVEPTAAAASMPRRSSKPRVGFAGLGWIGMHRLRAVCDAGLVTVAAIADGDPRRLSEAAASFPGAATAGDFEAMLDRELDGVVIATPSGMHADQATAALLQGISVFCQKPLARDASETRRVVDAARRADRLLAVDFSYRSVRGVHDAKRLIQDGSLGELYLVELTFHNAYGPDKPWFYSRSLSGGGCVLDLGIHLIDLAQWLMGERGFNRLRSRLWYGGGGVPPSDDAVEDTAVADWETPSGAQVRLACSWRLHAGQEAVIAAAFYGTQGAVRLRNLHGSFYDFAVEHCVGTGATPLAANDSEWGGRAIVDWASRLAVSAAYDPAIESVVDVAALIDEVYGR